MCLCEGGLSYFPVCVYICVGVCVCVCVPYNTTYAFSTFPSIQTLPVVCLKMSLHLNTKLAVVPTFKHREKPTYFKDTLCSSDCKVPTTSSWRSYLVIFARKSPFRYTYKSYEARKSSLLESRVIFRSTSLLLGHRFGWHFRRQSRYVGGWTGRFTHAQLVVRPYHSRADTKQDTKHGIWF